MTNIDALVCAEPGRLELVRRAAPSPALDCALVLPRRVGICGTDYHIFEGNHPFLEYPRVMGHELAVEVMEAPVNSAFKPGEICVVNPYISCGCCVACRAGKPNCCVTISVLGVHEDGGMAGLFCVPVGNLVRAEGLTVDECASVEFLSIGAHAVRRAGVTDRDRVLVVGAGPIGLGVALFADMTGAEVTVFDRDLERADTARAILGVSSITADGEPSQVTGAIAGDDGFDVVFDATGNRQAMENGFDYVCHGGRYVLVSVIKDSISFADPDFHRKEMTLFGSRNATSEDFEHVIAAMKHRKVPVDRLITHRTTLQEAVRNIPVWAGDKAGLIKALIEID